MLKKIVSLLFVSILGASCALAASALDKDTLIAGTESTYPPYESRNSAGQLEGFDIELTEIVAARLGKKVQWVDMPFDSLIPSLMTGKIDLVAAGMSATEERAKRVNFSEPYVIPCNIEASASPIMPSPTGRIDFVRRPIFSRGYEHASITKSR